VKNGQFLLENITVNQRNVYLAKCNVNQQQHQSTKSNQAEINRLCACVWVFVRTCVRACVCVYLCDRWLWSISSQHRPSNVNLLLLQLTVGCCHVNAPQSLDIL